MTDKKPDVYIVPYIVPADTPIHLTKHGREALAAREFAVHRSLVRIVTIGTKRYRLWAEDWASAYQAEEAATACNVALHRLSEDDDGEEFDLHLPMVEALLGTLVREQLGVDDERPYAFSIMMERA